MHLTSSIEDNLSIKEMAKIALKAMGAEHLEIKFDSTKPDGSPRKFLDSRKINSLDFKTKTSLKEGLVKTYQDFTKA